MSEKVSSKTKNKRSRKGHQPADSVPQEIVPPKSGTAVQFSSKEEGGFIRVRRTVSRFGKVVKSPHESGSLSGEDTIAISKFSGPHATVGLGYRMTKNMGNFESVSVDVSLSVPCYPEEVDDAFQYAERIVTSRIEAGIGRLCSFPPQTENNDERIVVVHDPSFSVVTEEKENGKSTESAEEHSETEDDEKEGKEDSVVHDEMEIDSDSGTVEDWQGDVSKTSTDEDVGI